MGRTSGPLKHQEKKNKTKHKVTRTFSVAETMVTLKIVTSQEEGTRST